MKNKWKLIKIIKQIIVKCTFSNTVTQKLQRVFDTVLKVQLQFWTRKMCLHSKH